MEAFDKFLFAVNDKIINPLIILMFAIALIVFIWGLAMFIAKGGDEDARETAKRHILYGVLGMFIMVSAFALARVITGSLGIDTTDSLDTVQAL